MSIINVSLVDSTTFKPILIQASTLYNFADASKSTREAIHKIVNYKNKRKSQKQFRLESGLIMIYEDFWSQLML